MQQKCSFLENKLFRRLKFPLISAILQGFLQELQSSTVVEGNCGCLQKENRRETCLQKSLSAM